MTINAYPLQWPTGWKRTQHVDRRSATFNKKTHGNRGTQRLTIADGAQRVLAELEAMGYGRDDIVISTNVELRLDGLPRSDRSEPGDPGTAVYWRTRKGEHKVMAVDRYDRVADNLAAIAATLEAMRAIERHGGALILERAFTGFAALPAPGAKREWWEILGVERSATRDTVRGAYRALASKFHPDKPGGSHEKMAELNSAQEAALLECAS
jgi:hypothetical protein